jgi:hypothetical protein
MHGDDRPGPTAFTSSKSTAQTTVASLWNFFTFFFLKNNQIKKKSLVAATTF